MGNNEWLDRHETTLDQIEEMLPSGSGIDCGTKIDRDKTTGSKIVLTMSYHHMNDNGFYVGWTDHTITITPSFDGIDVAIGGRNRNNIKDYLHEVYYHALSDLISYDEKESHWYSLEMRKAQEAYQAGIANGTIV